MTRVMQPKAVDMVHFPDRQTRKCKGHGVANADAIEVLTKDDATYLSARIASTGNVHYAWLSMPSDPAYLRELADMLNHHANWIEATR